MSGHSKFANIKHKKEKNDAAKGKIFTIIGRELAVAVKEGGPDPANNSKLRDVIAKAKANNMPNDTIDRGIKKAAGDANSVNYEFVSYEGYGPNGTAIIVDALTDNKNRTAANVRSAFTKGYGNVGLGNIVGANILNLVLVMGIPAAVTGISLNPSTVRIDAVLGVVVMAILTVPLMIKQRSYRVQGGALLAIYVGYVVLSFVKGAA